MKTVLVVQPDPLDPPALVGERLAARGIEMIVADPTCGESARDYDAEADGLVIMGGPQSVLDPAHEAMFDDMYDAVRRFHGTGRPVLGVCLGGQVVARAFGAEVRRVGELQFGFLPVRLRASAAGDSLLQELPDESRIFCWHEDCFSLPEGAVWLAETDRVPNYAFRMGKSTYGFQCHFEFTGPTLDAVLQRGRHLVPKNLGARGVALLERLPADRARHFPSASHFGGTIADRWAELVLRTGATHRAGEEAATG